MPATLTAPHLAPILPLRVLRPELIRPTGTGRCCPVCAEPRCADAEFCRAYFADRDWINCLDCGGTGYDTAEFQIWCPICGGAKVVEAGVEA